MSEGSPPTLALFEAFPASRILLEDADVVVIDKPFGLATHAPDEGRKDDVVSWLRAHYERVGASPYLGIHQRLDRDTSGVLLFARRREANPDLARQFEGKAVQKRYVAIVEGRVPDKTVLCHYLSEDRATGRSARAADGRPRRGELEAITDLATLERKGRRSLVELSPKTGRTHQLRLQLRAIGAPIVGDVEYAGAPAPRLMLHARSLALLHPSTGAKLRVTAQIPQDFERVLAAGPIARPSSREALTDAFARACERRYGILGTDETNAARIVNGAADGLPGITVDLYARHAVLSFYESIEPRETALLAGALLDAGVEGVYAKFRPKHASRIVDSRTEDVAPSAPIAGAPAPDAFEVFEHGVPHEVRLGDGLSTGIFLDQRENRARVAELAKGKRLLNLFCYTATFSIVAARAGARATTSVDVSRGVLERARAALSRAGASEPDHVCVEADVFAFLSRARARGDRWDVVVLDPPSFSTTKKTTFSAESDYEALAALALAVVAPGGRVLACTNHHGTTITQLRKRLHRAAEKERREVVQMKNLPAPADFPPAPGEEPHLKSVLVSVR